MPSKIPYKKKHPDKKLGRKPKKVDLPLLEKLAKLHLSDKVIAECLNIHPDTLRAHFSSQIDAWQSKSKGKIAEVVFDQAVNQKEPWALKMLAQKHLGYTDKVEQVNRVIVSEDDDLTLEEINERLNQLSDLRDDRKK
jgi:hypothetical protein